MQERQEHQGHQKGFRAGAQSRDAKRHPRNALRYWSNSEKRSGRAGLKRTAGASGASEGFQGGRAEPGCQTSPKDCIKRVEQ